MNESTITTLGVIAVAIIGGIGTWWTGKQARGAAKDSGDSAERKSAVDGYAQFSEQLLTRVAGLEGRVDGLTGEVRELGRQLSRAQRALSSAIAYVDRLLGFISEHLPHHTDVPPMPLEVREQMDRQTGQTS